MYTLVTFATQWGSKHGGINSFNADFLTNFAFAYRHSVQVICIVASDVTGASEDASRANVTLVPILFTPKEGALGPEHSQAGIDELARRNITYEPDKTVWLGHDRFTGEAAAAAAINAGGRSAVIHHMSYDHYESYAESSKSALGKTQQQIRLLQKADVVLAVGPLLRDAAKDRLSGSKPVHMLIPGLAQIEVREAPSTFVAFLSGRLSNDATRIKQGHLGIAAFAKAEGDAIESGMPDALCKQPKLLIRGVDFGETLEAPLSGPPQSEVELKGFAEKYARKVVNLHALAFTEDREQLLSELAGSSVVLMPSWHEGFGLAAWEAIAAGVPLILGKNSGVYRLLEDQHPGAEIGYVDGLEIRGKGDLPYFRDEDLVVTVAAIREVAKNPARARLKASILRNMLGDYTWSACAEQAATAFDWELEKGSLPPITPDTTRAAPSSESSTGSDGPSLLKMPAPQWRPNAGMADSHLLRAEETLLPFDAAREPDVDTLNDWLDDTRFPQSVRLITGAGGQGKTRLALELCQRRLALGWQAGFLDSTIAANQISFNWKPLRNLNQPLLIIIDYAETRQTALLALLKAVLQNPWSQPVRILLLARDGGEWWDNLPSKDTDCEALLSGYATTGAFQLPALYAAETDRRLAFKTALEAFARVLGVGAPDIDPDLLGEQFERPLYVQMAALLALYGERPITAEGLTKALLNHERRYWTRLLEHFGWSEPARRAEQLLALGTLAGGFAIPRDAKQYWDNAGRAAISTAEFNLLFRELATLYPGTQGLEALRPDLLGEALVAQALLRPQSEPLLDAVLSNSASQLVRRNALTVIARLSTHRLDLGETIIDALVRQLGQTWKDLVAVSRETLSRLPELAEEAFSRLSPGAKSQVAGVLAPIFSEESVLFAQLSCLIYEYLAEKSGGRFSKRQGDLERMSDYAGDLISYARSLYFNGRHESAIKNGLESVKLYRRLCERNRNRFEPNYAVSLMNLANYLRETGQNEEALEYAFEAQEINKRLAQKNPDRFESEYAMSLSNYATHLSDAGQNEEALAHAFAALEINKRLAQKNPDRFESEYAGSLSNYATYFSEAGQNEEALAHAFAALEIRKRLAQKNPDRFESEYAGSLNNYADHLSDAGQNEEALAHAIAALEIRRRLTQKNPDRFEPDYAKSLSNYANYLSDAGQTEEALAHAFAALEIRKRLAQKNPDRFEPEYAKSLNNYANRLSDAGQNEEAVAHAFAALEIRKRLAQKNPKKAAEDLFITACLTRFLAWLGNQDHADDEVDLDQLLTFVPPHQRSLMHLFAGFVEGCLSADQVARSEEFRKVLANWNELSVAQKTRGEPYWLCAAAWNARFGKEIIVEPLWEANWQRYAKQRRGRVPEWMLEVARRLGFEWPPLG